MPHPLTGASQMPTWAIPAALAQTLLPLVSGVILGRASRRVGSRRVAASFAAAGTAFAALNVAQSWASTWDVAWVLSWLGLGIVAGRTRLALVGQVALAVVAATALGQLALPDLPMLPPPTRAPFSGLELDGPGYGDVVSWHHMACDEIYGAPDTEGAQVVHVGDSVVYGLGFQRDDAFPAKLGHAQVAVPGTAPRRRPRHRAPGRGSAPTARRRPAHQHGQ